MKFSKSFFARLFWFLVGGIGSIWVNAGLFRLFSTTFGWSNYVAYALSLTIVTVLLFLWNYVVGFKTDRHWTDAAWRQGVCQGVCIGLNYLLVMILLKALPHCPDFIAAMVDWSRLLHERLVDYWKEVIIAGVQVFIAFFKFGLYHYWVYPQRAPAIDSLEPGQVS